MDRESKRLAEAVRQVAHLAKVLKGTLTPAEVCRLRWAWREVEARLAVIKEDAARR